ncbi:uncharacterized protein HMPREF1541_03412 [Cyphellophora europaea CBS 101466]|uniref:Mannose-1-phosphate guanyltransferase n=1 Tax=Cyphellophora europaea (strain CBS 101466) TaxID=1220924 RepID=W2RYA5_CYPE1|nr:uncharacterized protein HMPREF1541_03412 [Cyphellophora europaea CBS 101466]ETN41476.1 hypothetical protein HMPREF1541_03412 [Cyphellophora europaea CBS 101466]
MPHAEYLNSPLTIVPVESPISRTQTPFGLDGYFPQLEKNRSYVQHNGAATPDSAVSMSMGNRPPEGLNVIIPMGGIGSRFQKEGYRFPKPLIKIVGRPMLCWLIERLSLTSQDTLWLAVNEEVENEFQIADLVRKWFPKIDARLLKLNYLTRGATETLFIVTQTMSASHRRRRTVSLDCDTIYFNDILSQVRKLPQSHGGCFCFEDLGSQPIFSYIQVDEKDVITDVQEKNAISTHANTGAYVFPSAAALNHWATISLDSKLDGATDKVGEYYTSQLIELMIKTGGVPFSALRLDNDEFSCVGTPRQLDDFLVKISQNDSNVKPKLQRFCFDLDMTLVGMPEVSGDYSTCPPLWDNIELVRSLHKAGHYVIIQTARRMRTHNGNVGAVIADIGPVTLAQLAKYEIPYHEVVFGKPYAHVYVDDLAVNANLDTRKEIGWLGVDAANGETNKLAELKHAKKAGIVPSRDFNHVQILGERVMKSSKSPKLLAEMFFYSHIPAGLSDLFPKLYSASFFEETSTYSFTMEKLQGVSYSHLVTARSLTRGRLRLMLEALYRVHSTPTQHSTASNVDPEIADMFAASSSGVVNIYANYAAKMKSRYTQHVTCYRALGDELTSRLYNTLLSRLETYETNKEALPAALIHGDPVFSNVVLNESARKVSFYDVRSQQGDTLTTEGDICYDLAKVLQSLQGYDHVVLADPETLRKASAGNGWGLGFMVKAEDRLCLRGLQEVFWQFVQVKYEGKVEYQTLLTLVASLMFTLIPLHREVVRPIFLQMCANVLEHDVGFPL